MLSSSVNFLKFFALFSESLSSEFRSFIHLDIGCLLHVILDQVLGHIKIKDTDMVLAIKRETDN